MELFLTICLILGMVLYSKYQDLKSTIHCNTYKVDWGKADNDRLMNNLSQDELNKNIAAGKYDTGEKW